MTIRITVTMMEMYDSEEGLTRLDVMPGGALNAGATSDGAPPIVYRYRIY